ncbi:MAG: hypothetical protein U9O94_08370 [Nanoarchaeota archaeon]|nr:hypothetical protein [Nanoarchaeota archaeon]
MDKTKHTIIYLAEPKIRVLFKCKECNDQYKTTEIVLKHTCKNCKKTVEVEPFSYSLDSVAYYLVIIHKALLTDTKFAIRTTAPYYTLAETIKNLMSNVGVHCIKDHMIQDINKRNQSTITVRELLLEKIGAIQ